MKKNISEIVSPEESLIIFVNKEHYCRYAKSRHISVLYTASYYKDRPTYLCNIWNL